MVSIKAFRAFRPRPQLAQEVASRPYDVMNRNEAKLIAEENPDSFIRVIRSEVDFPGEVSPYDKEVYHAAGDNFQSLVDRKILVQDGSDSLYLYKQIMGDVEQTGLVCLCSIDDYFEGRIKKHEFTRPTKEKDRINHIKTTGIHTGPVFNTYRNNKKIDELFSDYMKLHEADISFTDETDVQHIIWKIDRSETIQEILGLFNEEVEALYIADGHHRAASTSKVGKMERERAGNYSGEEPFNFFLSVIFPDNQVNCMDYNRVITDLNGHSKDDFLTLLAQKFEIDSAQEESVKPSRPRSFGMYLDGKWYALTAKYGLFDPKDPVSALDVSILQEHVFYPLLGIKDQRTDDRIDFVGGIRGMKELSDRVDSGEMALAFSIYPVRLLQLFDVADSGEVMPPKSTWFEPKLLSGLFSYRFRD